MLIEPIHSRITEDGEHNAIGLANLGHLFDIILGADITFGSKFEDH